MTLNSVISTISVLAIGFIGFTSNATTVGHSCLVRKSLMWVNAEGKLQIRSAKTSQFVVVSAEHETPYALPLVEESGTPWGEVKVSTGTIVGTPDGDVIQAEAVILNEDGSIASRIATVFATDTKLTRAMTILDLPDTDFDPNLELECRLLSSSKAPR